MKYPTKLLIKTFSIGLLFVIFKVTSPNSSQREIAGTGSCQDEVPKKTFVSCTRPYQYDPYNSNYDGIEMFSYVQKLSVVGKLFQPKCTIDENLRVQDKSERSRLQHNLCAFQQQECLKTEGKTNHCLAQFNLCRDRFQFAETSSGEIDAYCLMQGIHCKVSNYSKKKCRKLQEKCEKGELKYSHNLSSPRKKPYLFYYGIDTKEPFMQTAIDYELHSLKKVCTTDYPGVYWFAVINSFVDKINKYGRVLKLKALICNDEIREGTNERWHHIEFDLESSEYDRLLRNYREGSEQVYYKNGEIYLSYLNPNVNMDILDYAYEEAEKKIWRNFKKYILTNPNTFIDLFKVSQTYFKAKKFMPFVHLKSHGSPDFLLTGLSKESEEEKVTCQKDAIKAVSDFIHLPKVKTPLGVNSKFTPEDEDYLFYSGLGYVHMFTDQSKVQRLGIARMGIARMGEARMGDDRLGEEQALGVARMGIARMGESGLGVARMGEARMGVARMGNRTGLGVGSNLRADNHFGFAHTKLPHALQILFGEKSSTELGFLMFEACDTNFNKTSDQYDYIGAYLPNIKAFYSAKGSLWFRNLNWDELLVTAAEKSKVSFKGQAAILQEMLLDVTANIPNYYDVEEPNDK